MRFIKNKERKQTVSGKLLLVLLPLIVVIILFITGFMLIRAKAIIMEQATNGLLQETKANGSEIAKNIENICGYYDAFADMIENTTFADDQELLKSMKPLMNHFPETSSGAYIGFEDGAFIDTSGWEPPEDDVPSERDWYVNAKGNETMTLGVPYMDMTTEKMVVPISREITINGKRKGVMSADMEIAKIVEDVSSYKPLKQGRTFLFSGDTVLSYYNEECNGNKVSAYPDDTCLRQLQI